MLTLCVSLVSGCGKKKPEEEAADESEEEAEPAPAEETKKITGTVAGYDLNCLTITVENDKDASSDNPSRPAEEPVADDGNDVDEFPSVTYDEVTGKELTYYSFDLREAAQSYKNGIKKGLVVTVYYKGDLSEMSKVTAVKVTDQKAK